MSRDSVYWATQVIANDLLALAKTILEDDSISNNAKVRKNTLRDSLLNKDLMTLWNTAADGNPVIQAFFNHYVVYLEWDRPPKYKKKPPISVLKEWASRNGIPTDADTLWAISTAIWRDGHAGRPIFATMDRELDKLYANDWSDKLFNAITDNLDTYFNAA